MANTVYIGNLDKAELLVRLWDASRDLEDSIPFSCMGRSKVTYEDASRQLKRVLRVGVFKGRFIEVDLGKAEVDPRRYDRVNGQGAFARVVHSMYVAIADSDKQ